MKKIVLALSASLLLAACAQDQAAAPAPAPARAATPAVAAAAPAARTATVSATTANLRAQPNNRARVLARLRRGTEVQVMETSGQWTKVMSGSNEGYIFSRSLR
ncbi:MAG: SH3 domain-containing protein [Alphaproteobacteria bacterium]|nr:SH3 domain-containing protein [Alphaproteobacteria bacterium]